MFQTYGAAWREVKRWWRDTPVGLKVLAPVVFLVLMLLPFEIASLGQLFENAGTDREGRDPRAPKDFGRDDDTPD